MKLKYYLRGLGIGIIVATLIMASAGGIRKSVMTDDEVRERASELGMVDEDDVLLSEAKRLSQGSESDDRISENKISANKVSGNKVHADEASENSISVNKTSENSVSEKTVSANDISADEVISSDEGVPLIITISIAPGDSSAAVAKKLLAAGVIKDAKQFDSYLCLNGYDRRLVTGSHMIPMNATPREIAEFITSK